MRSEVSVKIMLIDACFMTWEIVAWRETNVRRREKPTVYTIQQRLPCMKYISIENIDMKFTQMLWLIALQPQGWQVCILCNVIKNKILYVFRSTYIYKIYSTAVWSKHGRDCYSCLANGFLKKEVRRGWPTVVPSYLPGITFSTLLEYPNLWMLKSFIWNCRILVNNLCIFFSRQWKPSMAWVWTVWVRLHSDFFIKYILRNHKILGWLNYL